MQIIWGARPPLFLRPCETCAKLHRLHICTFPAELHRFHILYFSCRIAQVSYFVHFLQNCTGFIFCTFPAEMHRFHILEISCRIAQVSYFEDFLQNCMGFIYYTFPAELHRFHFLYFSSRIAQVSYFVHFLLLYTFRPEYFYQMIYKPSYCNIPERRKKYISKKNYLLTLNIICSVERNNTFLRFCMCILESDTAKSDCPIQIFRKL